LIIVAVLAFAIRGRRRPNRLSTLSSLSFGCIIAGILFGADRMLDYGLLCLGVILVVADIFLRLNRH
jgi:hypothetical protein